MSDSDPEIFRLASQTEIASMMELLRSGRANEDHKCPDVGRLQLNYPNKSITLTLLPGHDERFYEFRHDGNYQVDRASFLKLLSGKELDLKKLMEKP